MSSTSFGGVAFPTPGSMDDLQYVEFSETHLMPFSTEACVLPFSLSILFFYILLHMVILKCDDYIRVRLVLLVATPLTFLVCLSWFMPIALMALFGSVLWDVT